MASKIVVKSVEINITYFQSRAKKTQYEQPLCLASSKCWITHRRTIPNIGQLGCHKLDVRVMGLCTTHAHRVRHIQAIRDYDSTRHVSKTDVAPAKWRCVPAHTYRSHATYMLSLPGSIRRSKHVVMSTILEKVGTQRWLTDIPRVQP